MSRALAFGVCCKARSSQRARSLLRGFAHRPPPHPQHRSHAVPATWLSETLFLATPSSHRPEGRSVCSQRCPCCRRGCPAVVNTVKPVPTPQVDARVSPLMRPCRGPFHVLTALRARAPGRPHSVYSETKKNQLSQPYFHQGGYCGSPNGLSCLLIVYDVSRISRLKYGLAISPRPLPGPLSAVYIILVVFRDSCVN